MANLTVALLGLTRTTGSVGLALRRYANKGGKHNFTVIGHDLSKELMKEAQTAGFVDRSEGRITQAIADVDLVMVDLSYDQMEATFRILGDELRAGAVVLDLSPLKRPSVAWADTHFNAEQHLVGITAIVNPRYIFEAREDLHHAEEDFFDDSAILLSPAPDCIKEAVDLAFNFCQILGSRPRFLDPLEHDTLLAHTNDMPQILGVTLFYQLMGEAAWDDMKWLTNPAFGVLTRPLFDIHPDAMRDAWHANRDVLTRVLDQYIETLQQMRTAIADGDKSTIEAVTSSAAKRYEEWINERYRADWDADAKPKKADVGGGLMQTLLGDKLANRISGKGDADDD
jgi:prephenate dehydrogenase